ncbi:MULTISPECIES: hypothetical protein [unclassified Moorena]|uniref:hypothetical protein n=1 Tax=unclassified Moorena TaxID=2683338 RepID=UPI0013FE9380|nr:MULTISPECIES: hypothetical protein [unclassified Moorena]NEO15386.1 hypothetical protein [Moorena sp. SIO3E8]NEQ01112.1 hypothetical protein [Moorena sp. SIO3F7]
MTYVSEFRSDAAREQGSQCGLGGSPHEQLAWFPPLALCMADNVLTFMGSAISSPERLSINS